jgi:hypothetical protein
MNQLTDQIVFEAHKHIGVKEVGHNDGPEVAGWLARVFRKPGNAWCAAWAWCMLDDACTALGLVNPMPPTAGVHLLIERAKLQGAWSDEPGPGFIFAIDHGRDKHGNRIGHCGIVLDVGDGTLATIEANTNEAGSREGDCVAVKTRKLVEVTLGYLDPGRLLVGQTCSEAAPGNG